VFQGGRGELAPPISEAYPKAEAVPCATFEDCFRGAARRGSWRYPDREIVRAASPHSSSDADLEAAHRRRAFHAGAPSALALKSASLKTLKRWKATSTRSASAATSSAARHQGGGRQPNRGLGGECPRPATRTRASIATSSRQDLWARVLKSTSRTRSTTPPLRHSSRTAKWGAAQRAKGRHDFVFRCATFRRRSTRRSAVSHQTAST